MSAVVKALLQTRARTGRVCIAVGVVAAGDYGVLSWLPTILQRDYGMSASAIGSAIGGAVAFGGLFGAVAAGWVSDWVVARLGIQARLRVMIASYALCVAAALLLCVSSATALVAAATLWVVGSVAGNVVANAVLQESVQNEMRATVIALLGMSSAIIGMGLGPTMVVLVAKLLGGSDQALSLGVFVVCLAAALAGSCLILQRGRD